MFASWRQGASLDIREWLTPKQGRTPAVIVSVAHLDDEELLLSSRSALTRSPGAAPILSKHLGPALQSLLTAAAATGAGRADVQPNDLLRAVSNLCVPDTGHSQRMTAVLLDTRLSSSAVTKTPNEGNRKSKAIWVGCSSIK